MLRSLVFCVALLAAACGPQADPAKPAVEIATASKTFGVILHAPADWYVASDEEFKVLRQAGVDASLGDDQELKRIADASQQARTLIFAAFRYGPDAVVDFNPSVYASATSVAQAPDMSARRYLRDALPIMRALGPPITVDGDFRTREIDGHTIDFFRAHHEANGVLVTQDHYAVRRGDDMINFIQSYAGDDQYLETEKVMSALELDW